tara:strand:+ start:78 stop:650 length:573 start_codon:yes stop_codon:yes gene_type:complete
MPEITEVSLQLARPFIEQWHYSGKTPTGKNIFWGWIDNMDCIYSIADYGIGVNPYQAEFLAREMNQPVTKDNLIELKRLCRREPRVEEWPLSSFLSKCHKQLSNLGFRYVVSFSDPAHGHNGGIYKASSFDHLGQTQAEWHLEDVDGGFHHRRYAYRYAQRKGVTLAEARKILGLTRVKTPPKDRWVKQI